MEFKFKPTTRTGDTRSDMIRFFRDHHYADIADRSLHIGSYASELAEHFSVVPSLAERGGWLHNLSVVIPAHQLLTTAKHWDVNVFQEEQQCPELLRQKLSAVMARDLFHIKDDGVLSAIECHTTLKAGMLPLDKVVFLSIQLAEVETEPLEYLKQMRRVLYEMPSLDAAIKVYCDYRWEHRDHDIIGHRWFLDKSFTMEQI